IVLARKILRGTMFACECLTAAMLCASFVAVALASSGKALLAVLEAAFERFFVSFFMLRELLGCVELFGTPGIGTFVHLFWCARCSVGGVAAFSGMGKRRRCPGMFS